MVLFGTLTVPKALHKVSHSHTHTPMDGCCHEGAPGPIGSNFGFNVLPKDTCGQTELKPTTLQSSIKSSEPQQAIRMQSKHEHDDCAYDWTKQAYIQ